MSAVGRPSRLAESALILATVAEAAIFAAIAPGFFSIANLVNIALSLAVTGILAVGMTAVMVTGGIDLGVGSVVALSGVVAAIVAGSGAPLIVAIAAALAVGVVTGLVNGVLVAWCKVPAFIATLAMLTSARGLAYIVSGGESHGDLPASFGILGRSLVLGIPTPVLVLAGAMLAGAFLLNRTVFGRHIYAIGGNSEASWLAGIDIRGVLWRVYALNGLLTGLAGMTLASRLGAGVPNSGLQYELDVIAACVVGGTSLNGGRGSIGGTLWGTVFIGVLTNGLNLANVDPYLQKIALGVVIVLAVIGDQVGRRSR
ncbi:MAG TPA: ABC transporter permease [Gemmatimonadales bacterium]|jgi:ribose/xylose/arabinose/galactoside ABC-type transport system permease subunit|nr:ABC transporter permease [Gemmatimonadales bacterium]